MIKMCGLHRVAYWLMWVGAINWGLVGLFKWNLVNALLGQWSWLERLVYILVGLSAVLMLFCKQCKACKLGSPEEEKKQ